jgi:hypothetical protein
MSARAGSPSTGVPMRRVSLLAACGAWLTLVSAAPALAQTPQPSLWHRIDITIAAEGIGSSALASKDVTLVAPDGSPYLLYRTSDRLSAGKGVELHIGVPLFGHVRAEASGSFSRSQLRTSLSGDVEGADAVTATSRLSRFTVEGSAMWLIKDDGRLHLFVRGGGGWMRELAANDALSRDGGIASVGGGMIWWWRPQGLLIFKRFGLRAEAQATGRRSGMWFGNHDIKVAPVVTVGVTFALW